MTIVVNGDTTEIDARQTLDVVVATIVSDKRGVAAAVNGEVVPRTQWDVTRLSPGDRIEVLSAIGGG
ncbi:MAG: sulfur carrier protein [Actinomycetota bacterium]|nr:sulfur carrier protein [Actinomycetota bacterium]MEA2487353.1 sulfur carrier protein [Actinomycetota bacterium]